MRVYFKAQSTLLEVDKVYIKEAADGYYNLRCVYEGKDLLISSGTDKDNLNHILDEMVKTFDSGKTVIL